MALWWYSITSTVSNQGAASSAKRISNTAETAKLGAHRQCAGPSPNAERTVSKSAPVRPVVPLMACTPCIASHGNATRAASAVLKSTTTSQPASANARSSWPRPTVATSSRSSAAFTAATTACPILPLAPCTPTLITHPTVLPGAACALWFR